VVRLLHQSAVTQFEDLEHVVELPVHVADDIDRPLQEEHIPLLDEDLGQPFADRPDVPLLDELSLPEPVDNLLALHPIPMNIIGTLL
jgi:hypothetical protein